MVADQLSFDVPVTVDAADPWWRSCVMQAVLDYGLTHTEPFLISDVARWANVPEPSDPVHGWGSVTSWLRRQGIIRVATYGASTKPGANGSLRRMWVLA